MCYAKRECVFIVALYCEFIECFLDGTVEHQIIHLIFKFFDRVK